MQPYCSFLLFLPGPKQLQTIILASYLQADPTRELAGRSQAAIVKVTPDHYMKIQCLKLESSQ